MNTVTKEMFPFPIIRKRDGRMTRFDISKISGAIYKAFFATGIDDNKACDDLASLVIEELLRTVEGNVPQVEDIQDVVERILIQEGYAPQAKAYILYRAKRTSIREGKSELMDSVESILQETQTLTTFPFNSPSAKMLRIAAAACRNFYLTRLIPSQFSEAHNRGDIHIHDLDYYGKTISSLQLPLGELLTSGFYSGYSYIRPPKHFSTIGALTAILLQACQNDMFGGQSIPEMDSYLGDYIRKSLGSGVDARQVFQTMEGLVYNLNMMYSRVGSQVPASTINIGLDMSTEGRMVAEGLLKALDKGLGRGETPMFPWVVYHVRDGVNFKPGDPNYDLYQLAIRVASRRMNPSFAFRDAKANYGEDRVAYWGDGSRASSGMVNTFVNREDLDDDKPWGWGSIAQVTVNLPRVAFKISHKRKDFLLESFRSELRRTLELCARQLLHRKDVISALKMAELPFVMGEKVYKGTRDTDENSTLEHALKYGTLNINFVGLAETLYILDGKDHGEDPRQLESGLEIVDLMQDYISDLSREFEANFFLSASSAGYATQRFAQLDRIEFGITPRINDKRYYTHGFGLPGSSTVPWKQKLEIEGKFCDKVPGGHFTYIASKGIPDPEKYEEVLKHMKESGVALGGVTFPLVESLEDGSIVTDSGSAQGRIRKISRAAGLLLPEERINNALLQELQHRHADLD